jgi:drug/metabolite transporter (DMT)-like permease
MPAGYLALIGRIVCLGLERPYVKALSRGSDPTAAATLYFGLGLLFILPLWLWQWLHTPGYFATLPEWLWAALLTGAIYAVAFHAYVRAMAVGEVSYLTPLYATAFLWLYALDVISGNAMPGPRPLAGIACVCVGVVLLNLPPGARGWDGLRAALSPATLLRQPGAWGMLIYAFGLATARLIDKHVSGIAPPLAYAFINNAPCVLAGLALLAWLGRLGDLPLLARTRPAATWVGGAAGIFAYLCLLLALRSGLPPSTVEPVTQLSVFIAVAFGGLWFKEQVQARWLPSALMVAGAVLLLWK